MRRFIGGLLLLHAFYNCTHKIPEVDQIEKLEKEVADRSRFATEADYLKKVLELTRAYEKFAYTYPNYPQAPEYLFKAAQYNASTFNDPKAAIMQLKRLEDLYRNRSPYASQALFQRAYLYANMLGDTLNARKLYEEFLALYPNTPWQKMHKPNSKIWEKPPTKSFNLSFLSPLNEKNHLHTIFRHRPYRVPIFSLSPPSTLHPQT